MHFLVATTLLKSIKSWVEIQLWMSPTNTSHFSWKMTRNWPTLKIPKYTLAIPLSGTFKPIRVYVDCNRLSNIKGI